MEFQTVLDAVRAWPIDDQERLVDLIRDDLVGDPTLTAAQKKEIKRRLSKYDANPRGGLTSEQFEDHMEKQLKELGE